MTRGTRQFIWVVALFAIFTLFELALPLRAHAGSQYVLVAKQDLMGARLRTTAPVYRSPCYYVSCVPTYTAYKASTLLLTAYSSTPDQTSGNPFITASGAHVHDGTLAINGIPFGTKIRIPDYFGDKIFTVEDRMSSCYSSYRGDIWMKTRYEAKQWGARRVRVEFVNES